MNFRGGSLWSLDTFSRGLAIIVGFLSLATFVTGSQAQQATWPGTVEVSKSTISVAPGKTVSYSVRLSEVPSVNGTPIPDRADWFVMLHINGVRNSPDGEYLDLSVVPGLYRTFNNGDWDQWKEFRVTRQGEDYVGERAVDPVFTHEVWDHNSNCPVHNVGPVTIDTSGTNPVPPVDPSLPDDPGNGGDGNGGDGNGGDGNGGDGNGGDGNGDGGNGDGGNGGEGDGENSGKSEPPSSDAVALELAVAPSAMAEASGEATVTVRALVAAFAEDRTIRLTLGGTASKGKDYTVGSEKLTLRAGQDSVSTTLRAVPDAMIEGAETIVVTATTPGGEQVGTAQTVTIVDDDAAVFDLSVAPSTMAEASGEATVTVRASGAMFAEDRTFALSFAGTALKGADYAAGSETLTLAAEQYSASTTLRAVPDAIVEGAETIVVTATASGGEQVGAAQTVTIVDDDTAALDLIVAPSTMAEASGEATVTVRASGATFAEDRTFTLSFAGTASKGTDYTAGAEMLMLLAGQDSVSTTLRAVPDAIVEGAETIVVTATAPGGEQVGMAQTATIADDDAVVLELAVAPSTMAEASGEATVTVRASGATFAEDRTFTLSFAGTASKGTDYTAGSDTLTLRVGQRSVSTTLRAVPDAIVEGTEMIVVTATASGGERVGTAQAVRIVDDDVAVLDLSATPPTIKEASGVATVAIRASGAMFAEDRVFTLSFAGTALEDVDYEVGSRTLVLRAGRDLVSTTLRAVSDEVAESEETIVVTATASGGGRVGTPQTVTIADDDPRVPDLSWLARFGRTVADHIIDALDERAGPGAMQSANSAVNLGAFVPGTFAGGGAYAFDVGSSGELLPVDLGVPAGFSKTYQDLSTRKFLLGNSFQFSMVDDDGPVGTRWTVWGRAAATHFDGGEGGLALDGDVITGLMGADMERGRVLAGLAVSHTVGEGALDLGAPYPGTTDVEATLTSVYPYVRYAASTKLSVWAALGFGQGEYKQDRDANRRPFDPEIGMRLGAIGARGELLSVADTGWYNVALKSDAFWVQIQSDPNADLESGSVDATRLRVGLEGWCEGTLSTGGVLWQSVELALRHENGDARKAAAWSSVDVSATPIGRADLPLRPRARGSLPTRTAATGTGAPVCRSSTIRVSSVCRDSVHRCTLRRRGAPGLTGTGSSGPDKRWRVW